MVAVPIGTVRGIQAGAEVHLPSNILVLDVDGNWSHEKADLTLQTLTHIDLYISKMSTEFIPARDMARCILEIY